MKLLKQGLRPWLGRSLLCTAALVLAACGGGGEQINKFQPLRLMSFGDESSVIISNPSSGVVDPTANGSKYTINGVDASTGLQDCALNPIWIQTVANNYGLQFVSCNPGNYAVPQARTFAAAGAKVADVQTQINAFLATDAFQATDLVTVLAGQNDVLQIYQQFPVQSEAQLTALAQQAGTALADSVNQIVSAGGHVIISTIPDLGLTPFALAEQISKQDVNRAQLLTSLTTAFNTAMRLQVVNDGHHVGLILADEMVEAAVKFPSAYGLTDVTDPACLTTVAVLNCTTKTLEGSNVTGSTYLWATSTLMGSATQARLGSLAVQRALNNPF